MRKPIFPKMRFVSIAALGARAGYPWKKLPPGLEGAAGKS